MLPRRFVVSVYFYSQPATCTEFEAGTDLCEVMDWVYKQGKDVAGVSIVEVDRVGSGNG